MLGILVAYLITFAIVFSIMLVLAVPALMQASAFVANMPTYEANVQAQARTGHLRTGDDAAPRGVS
jgi:hypothetical protein